MIKHFEKQRRPIGQINPITPDIQRPLDIEVVNNIVASENDYYTQSGKYILPNCISIVKCAHNEYIIDGQHRLSAYHRLSKDYPERELVIDIDYYISDADNLELLYKRVNTYTPNSIQSLSIDKYSLCNCVEKYICNNFSAYISKSSKPHAPSISLETIRRYFDEKGLFEITWTQDEIIEAIIKLNRYYASCSDEQFIKWRIEKRHLDSVRQKPNQLYFGVYTCGEWVDRLKDMKTMAPESLQHYSIKYRPKITKKLRMNVWKKYGINNLNQPCFCCGVDISFNQFECGHVIPISKGGSTTVDNLEPICGECNKDMGNMNLMEYKVLLGQQSPNNILEQRNS
jgi:5-methylcytosine-specific restriction endonuclease McrA